MLRMLGGRTDWGGSAGSCMIRMTVTQEPSDPLSAPAIRPAHVAGLSFLAARSSGNRADEPLPIPSDRANRKDATNLPGVGRGLLLDGLLEAARASRFWPSC